MPPLTPRKKLLYTLVTVALFFLLLEGSLRLAGVRPAAAADPFVGFAGSSPLFVDDGRGVMTTAPSKLRYFNPQTFPRVKPLDAYRIFCLGGSTTFGRPYDDATSFAGWLRALLPAFMPDRHAEVINAGGISYASYRVARVCEEVLQYDPDLIIVYCGHNEFLERRTYSDLLDQPVALQHTRSLLARTALYTALHRALKGDAPTTAGDDALPPEVDTILDRSIGPSDYHRDDAMKRRVINHYRYNLQRMAAMARDAGVDILFCTTPSNLRHCAPFKSDGPAQEAFDRARRLEAERRYDVALAEYRRARDEDVCPLRALTELRGIVLELPHTVDFVADVEAAAPHGIPGNDQFLDHVHPTIAVNRALALRLIAAMGRHSPPPQAVRAAVERVESSIDTRAHARAMANVAQVMSWAGKFDEAAVAARRAVDLDGDNAFARYFLGHCLLQLGDTDAAVEQLERSAALDPAYPRTHLNLGLAAARKGQWQEAIGHYRDALKLDGDDARAMTNLGAALQAVGRVDDAVDAHRRALAIDGGFAAARYNLANAYNARADALRAAGDLDAAVTQLRLAEQADPNHPAVQFNLGMAMMLKGDRPEAAKHFRRVLELTPGDAEARRMLAEAEAPR